MLFAFNVNAKKYAVINNHSFKLELAITNSQKSKGLAKYEKISNDFGMLFLMGKADYYNFWMKDMKFPIDIIYIKDDKIVDLFKNVENPKSKSEIPKSVKPKFPADKILEINAGLSNKYNFKKGDSVKIIY
jgi:hypothetical protein